MIERAKNIERAINDLGSTNPRVSPIIVSENLVQLEILPNGDMSAFPYHYNIETYQFIAADIEGVLHGG